MYDSDFEEFKKIVAPYTLDEAHRISGVPKDQLKHIAKMYADPEQEFSILTGQWASTNIPVVYGLTK